MLACIPGDLCLAGALYREFRESNANSDDFPWKNPHKFHHNSGVSAVLSLIMMAFCGFFQGKSPEVRMNSLRNSLYNAPAKKVSKRTTDIRHSRFFPKTSQKMHWEVQISHQISKCICDGCSSICLVAQMWHRSGLFCSIFPGEDLVGKTES